MNRKDQAKRLNEISAALEDERSRFNKAIQHDRKVAIMNTAFGPYQVKLVNDQHWYTTHPEGKQHDAWNQRSFAGCNDGTWSDLMRQVGEPRHPLFRRYA